MSQSGGFLLVVLGLLALWVVVSGKYDLLQSFFLQLFDLNQTTISSGVKGGEQKTTDFGQTIQGIIKGESPQIQVGGGTSPAFP